jgi:thymidylate kinase
MLTDPSMTPAARARDVWSHTLYGTRVRLRLRSQRAHLIALDGIDGSGKSAQAELLATALEGAALRHRIVWTRGGSSRLLQPVLKLGKVLLRRSAAISEPEPARGTEDLERARAALFRRPLVRAAWPWLVALELIPTYAAKIGWPLLRGEIVIADRYVLSALVEMAARLERPGIARSLPGLLLRKLSASPRRTIWFETPVDLALARKGGDESREFLAEQLASSRAVLQDVAAETVDAEQPLDVISDQLVTDFLGEVEDQHHTLLNGLFCANPRPLKRRQSERGLVGHERQQALQPGQTGGTGGV